MATNGLVPARTGDDSDQREPPLVETDGNTIREWTVRVFVLREAQEPEERCNFTAVSSVPVPQKGESIEISGRHYGVGYRKFRFCSCEGAMQIAVDLYVVGEESYGLRKLECQFSMRPCHDLYEGVCPASLEIEPVKS